MGLPAAWPDPLPPAPLPPPRHAGSTSALAAPQPRAGRSRVSVKTYAAKQLHFNTNGEALKRMQAGVDKLATVVGITLGPKVCSSQCLCERRCVPAAGG